MKLINLIALTLIIFCPLGSYLNISYPSIYGQQSYFLLITPILLVNLVFKLITAKNIKINYIDIFFIVFVSYLSSRAESLIQAFYFLGIVTTYLNIRYIDFKSLNYVIFLLLLSIIIQFSISELQLFGILESPNSIFKLTGTFFNPAPLAGFIVILLPFAHIHFLQNYTERPYNTIIKNLAPICLIASIIILITSNSRAAILSWVISMIYLYWNSSTVIEAKKRIGSSNFLKFGLILATSLTLSALYIYKAKSANGRLFIWSNSMDMLKETLLFGGGIDSFKKQYMLFQLNYFEKNGNDSYSNIADNVDYMYNEYLLLIVEHGLLGLVLLAILAFSILRSSRNSPEVRPQKASILSILIFSLFSYPSFIPAIIIFTVIQVATISNLSKPKVLFEINLETLSNYKVKTVFSLWTIVCAIGLLYYAIKYKMMLKEWKKADMAYVSGKHQISSVIYSKIFKMDLLNNNAVFLNHYSNALRLNGEYQRSENISRISMEVQPNTHNYISLSQALTSQGKVSEAEDYLRASNKMVPKLNYPKYLICENLYKTHQIDRFQSICEPFLMETEYQSEGAVREMRDSILKWKHILTKK